MNLRKPNLTEEAGDDAAELAHRIASGSLAPAGFYVAIRVGFAFPMVERNHLPKRWTQEYATGGLAVYDPAMAWAYQNQGFTRTADLSGKDSQGVLQLAKAHGLMFGAVVCCSDLVSPGERSIGLFFRHDRDYSDAELHELQDALQAVHRVYARPENLTEAELQTLSLVKNGLLMKEIASALGVSESAIKQRLRNARQKLNAKTGTQAAARATMLGMI